MDARTPGLRGMHEWLEAEKQRGSFAGPVHGPLGLEMVLADQRYAGAVEAVGAVGFRVGRGGHLGGAPSRLHRFGLLYEPPSHN